MEFVQWLVEHYVELGLGATAALGGIVAILKVIPGEQPGESALTKVWELFKKTFQK